MFPSNFLRFGGAFNLFVPLIVPVKKIIIQEENKCVKSEETAFSAPIFSALERSTGQISHIVKILKDFTEAD